MNKLNARTKQKKNNKPPRLDFKTWLYLYITKAVKVEHIPVVEVEEKNQMCVNDSKENEVYIFKDYDEYKKFFLMYLDDIEDGKSLTIDDALDILSLPLLGIVYEDHEMIEANNKGRPVYLLKGHLLHDCFDNIAHRLLGHKRAFTKCKRRGLLSRIFLG